MSFDFVSGLFTGIAGLAGFFALSTLGFFIVVLPLWAIVDALLHEREDTNKVVTALVLFVTWTFGALVYAVFLGRSRLLRWSTVLAVITAPVSVGAAVVAISNQQALEQGVPTRARQVAKVAAPPPKVDLKAAPASVAAGEFEALTILMGKYGPKSVSLTNYSLAGPKLETAAPMYKRLRHVARSGDRLYGLTEHDFGFITADGEFEQAASEDEDMSWPKGLAVNPDGGVVVMTSHVHNTFYQYQPALDEFVLFAQERDQQITGLVFDDEGFMLSLERPLTKKKDILRMHRYSAKGARVQTIELKPAIRLADATSHLQLRFQDGHVIVLIQAPKTPKDPILLIDPKTGDVMLPPQ